MVFTQGHRIEGGVSGEGQGFRRKVVFNGFKVLSDCIESVFGFSNFVLEETNRCQEPGQTNRRRYNPIGKAMFANQKKKKKSSRQVLVVRLVCGLTVKLELFLNFTLEYKVSKHCLGSSIRHCAKSPQRT